MIVILDFKAEFANLCLVTAHTLILSFIYNGPLATHALEGPLVLSLRFLLRGLLLVGVHQLRLQDQLLLLFSFFFLPVYLVRTELLRFILQKFNRVIVPLGPTQWAGQRFAFLLIVLEAAHQTVRVGQTTATVLAMLEVFIGSKGIATDAAGFFCFELTGSYFFTAAFVLLYCVLRPVLGLGTITHI